MEYSGPCNVAHPSSLVLRYFAVVTGQEMYVEASCGPVRWSTVTERCCCCRGVSRFCAQLVLGGVIVFVEFMGPTYSNLVVSPLRSIFIIADSQPVFRTQFVVMFIVCDVEIS